MRQEKERRELYEKMVTQSGEQELIHKLEQLEAKVGEYRSLEVRQKARIQQLEDDLAAKVKEFDSLLMNMESNQLIQEIALLTNEKEELLKELGRLPSTRPTAGTPVGRWRQDPRPR